MVQPFQDGAYGERRGVLSDERPDIQGRTDEYGVGSLGLFAEGRDAVYQLVQGAVPAHHPKQ